MKLPLSEHRYGEHGVVLPPDRSDTNDALEVDLDTAATALPVDA